MRHVPPQLGALSEQQCQNWNQRETMEESSENSLPVQADGKNLDAVSQGIGSVKENTDEILLPSNIKK